MNVFVNRLSHHLNRYRTVTYASCAILTTLFLFASAFYPGDSKASGMIESLREAGLDQLYGLSDINAVGWLFWLVLQLNTYLFYVSSIAAVLIGSKLVPTKNTDGLELIFAGSPQPHKNFVLENYLSGALSLLIIVFPGFLVISGFTWYFAGFDLINRIFITFLMSYLVSLVFMSGVALLTTIRFAESTGKKIGFSYLIFSFFFEVGLSSSEELKKIQDISLNHYVRPIDAIFNTNYPIYKSFILLFMIAICIVLCIYWVDRHDFTEKISEAKVGKKENKFFYPTSKLAQKHPLLAEQIRRDWGFIKWNTFMMAFLFVYLLVIYPGDAEVARMLGTFQSPILDAFLFNHTLKYTYLGFMTIEFYSFFYLYYGLFVTFASASVATKEVRESYHDIIWANNFTPAKIIYSRTIALLSEISVLLWSSYLFLTIFEVIFGLAHNVDHMLVFFVFLVNWLLYLSYALIIISITMMFQLSESRKYALWFYFVSILIILAAFLSDYPWIRYFSPFGYIDNAGMLFHDVSIWNSILSIIFLLPLSIILFSYSLKRKYWEQDLR